jgi:hypothetical protein
MLRVRPCLVVSALLALVAAASSARGADPASGRWAIEVACTTNPSRIIVSDPYQATITVKNTGDLALAKVTVVLRGAMNSHGSGPTAPEGLQQVVDALAPGESKSFTGTFASDVVGMTRVVGGAKDEKSFVTANAYCEVDVIGLPAVQSEMTDKDVGGAEKGIFLLGEEFLYVLDVQNDMGTTFTPDLKVVFKLPPELTFVSGSGDGVTVTGSEQSATTSTFVLTPNKGVKVTIRVRATARPATNLVKTTASIVTGAGVEIAEESESTTIK